ncbi:hypothetical protein I546_5352 [Mycobacterium kansasii 732]|nr:hypothetical protein [Mycobacterium pseudokansasii]EUA07736.1 hypothetical protein I546_5352 [Mycobacterium kansasii 732]
MMPDGHDDEAGCILTAGAGEEPLLAAYGGPIRTGDNIVVVAPALVLRDSLHEVAYRHVSTPADAHCCS